MEWFKFYGAEYLGDPKTRNFSAMYHSCWLHLLCFAANSSTPGVVEFLTEEDLMMYAGVSPMHDEWEQTKGVLAAFEVRHMVTLDRHIIRINNWDKRQEKYMTGAERTAKWRAKKAKIMAITNDGDEFVTQARHKSDSRIEENRKEIPANAEFLGTKENKTTFVVVPDVVTPRKSKDPSHDKYEHLCEWAELRRGFKFVHRLKQYAALKKAKQIGIGIPELKTRWMELEAETWRDGFDWTSVVSSFDKKK